MDFYLNIQILPDPEFAENLLLAALFSKLHKALVDVGQGEIGVSFPLRDKTLGATLRLHAQQTALIRLMGENWLKGMRDHIEVSAILPVPNAVQYGTVSRKQAKSNAERLRRRSVSKGWLSEAEALIKIPNANEQMLKLPFIAMKSTSSAQAFRLFISHGPLQAQAVAGRFSDYGLSSSTTIPVF